ncbi:LysR family transcriptional regulator [Neokomagataea anthophila]|uniref:LysR family transcriptional regulator n=1 Tax=Neokomagataea anthophila TaxID=2826925 RepID=A0ABS5E9I8_9PROT|nr:LysR family transcriptional regulator [Neokomagataea anthophila]MBR0560567.1 LysR family transcriptional regulator [Neokomagataea anthophila]
MRDNFDGVAIFVEVVEAGGFAKAAERIALTRSAVGKSIARLEARLGVQLFHRTTRSHCLTEEGQIYYEHCLRALEELRQATRLLDTGQREVRGHLKIAMPTLFGRYCVEPILIELARTYPSLELDLRFSDHVVDIIGEGFDLAVRHHALAENNHLHARKLLRQTKVVCASPSYLEQRGPLECLSQLSDHESLVYWHRDHVYPWVFQDRSGAEIIPELRWRLRFDHYEAILDATLKGMGVAYLPHWLAHSYIASGALVPVLEGFTSGAFDTYAVWPSVRYMPMRLRVVIDALVRELKQIEA